MSQYGLHRVKDNVASLCRNKITPTGAIKKCYWEKVAPIPDELKSLKIAAPMVYEEANRAPLCPPDDWEELKDEQKGVWNFDSIPKEESIDPGTRPQPDSY